MSEAGTESSSTFQYQSATSSLGWVPASARAATSSETSNRACRSKTLSAVPGSVRATASGTSSDLAKSSHHCSSLSVHGCFRRGPLPLWRSKKQICPNSWAILNRRRCRASLLRSRAFRLPQPCRGTGLTSRRNRSTVARGRRLASTTPRIRPSDGPLS
jgi:hypothetical protein